MKRFIAVFIAVLAIGCKPKIEVVPPCPPPPEIQRVERPLIPEAPPASMPAEERELRLIDIIRTLVAHIEILEGEVKSRDAVLDTYKQTKKSPATAK